MKISGIYKITNKNNSKIYVGSSYNIYLRKSKHYSDLNKNKHHSIKLQRAWNKYGESVFDFEVIESCNVEDLINKEQYYIDNLKPFYNCSKIAGSPLGVKRTKQQIINYSEGKKLAYSKLSENDRRNYAKHLWGWNKGKKMSDSMRIKLSKTNIERKAGKKLSEIKKKMIEEGTYSYRKTPVLQYTKTGEFVKEYDRLIDAAKSLNKNSTSCIIRCCKGIKPSAYGFIWKYKNN